MLEDIRIHSPTPTSQEVEWMAARPGRAAIYVSVLGVVALAIATVTVDAVPSLSGPKLAAVTPQVSGEAK